MNETLTSMQRIDMVLDAYNAKKISAAKRDKFIQKILYEEKHGRIPLKPDLLNCVVLP